MVGFLEQKAADYTLQYLSYTLLLLLLEVHKKTLCLYEKNTGPIPIGFFNNLP